MTGASLRADTAPVGMVIGTATGSAPRPRAGTTMMTAGESTVRRRAADRPWMTTHRPAAGTMTPTGLLATIRRTRT